MSGSDLAPFVAAVFEDGAVAGLLQENNELKVAAVLRDEVVDELIKENNVYKSRENKRLVVQITGVDGTPIHYETSFKNAEQYDDDIDDDIDLNFANYDRDDDITIDGFPLSSLNIEIRLGGVKVQQFNIDDSNISFGGLYDEEDRMEYIHITPRPNGSGPIEYVFGKIGPLPLGWRAGHAVGDEMSLTDFLERVADETNDLTPQTLIINALHFRRKDITGIMSFVTKMSEDMGD